MLKFLCLFSCWLIVSGSASQAPPVAFPDVPTITERSVGRARLGTSVDQLKELYKDCTFAPVDLEQYGENDMDDVLVLLGKQKLFAYFLDSHTEKKVAGIIVLHPAYKTANGLHIGSTSGELKAALPAIRTFSVLESSDVQRAFLKTSAIEYDFFRQKDIGAHTPSRYDKLMPIAIKTGRISWIQIFSNH